MMLKTNVLTTLLLLPFAAAFVPATLRGSPPTTATSSTSSTTTTARSAEAAASSKHKGGSSAELGIPCEDECAMDCFPNLPESVHPGVLSGQAQVDLLRHAKENGELVKLIGSLHHRHHGDYQCLETSNIAIPVET